MRGYRAIPLISSDVCAAGSRCPFALGPLCSGAAKASSSASHPHPAAGCPMGDSCLAREWHYDPPCRLFDVRHAESFAPNPSSVCFGAVHTPQQEEIIEYEQCSSVTVQGNARPPMTLPPIPLTPGPHACPSQARCSSRATTAASCAPRCFRRSPPLAARGIEIKREPPHPLQTTTELGSVFVCGACEASAATLGIPCALLPLLATVLLVAARRCRPHVSCIPTITSHIRPVTVSLPKT